MPPLRRHQLVYLSAEGWQQVLAREWDGEAGACLGHWAARGLPLVVTKQAALAGVDQPLARPTTERPLAHPTTERPLARPIALGLPAPAAWKRRRLMLLVPPAAIAWFGEFPPLAKLLPGLPMSARPPLQALCVALAESGLSANVYGSAGWQAITGLRYLHAASDLDLWIGVETAAAADRAVQALQEHAPASLRLDGELVFPDGSAIAWREWAMWRAGQCAALLVKRLRHSSIECHPVLAGEAMTPHASQTAQASGFAA